MCADAQPNNMWAISEARKMDLTRSLSALAKPAGETYLGSTTYAEVYQTDTLLQVRFELGQQRFRGGQGFGGTLGLILYELCEALLSTNMYPQPDDLTSPQLPFSLDPYPFPFFCLFVGSRNRRGINSRIFCANLGLLRVRWCWHIMSKVLDVDVAMESIMDAWFEQRHENRRQLAKTIETHRVIASGDQRLGFARLVCRKREVQTTHHRIQ